MGGGSGKPRGGAAIEGTPVIREREPAERRERPSADAEVSRVVDSGDRLTALQKHAARLQHSMYNPLAALLAEGQLLSMDEELAGEHRESVDRMIALTRRVIGLVRELDELRGTHPPR
jgi:hypothetical protein